MKHKIYVKTIDGRGYRYERIGSKRVGKQVITDDRYLGPVEPVIRGKIENTSPEAQQRLKQMYTSFATLSEMTHWFKEEVGVTVSGRTISNYMKRHGVKRGFDVELDMSDLQKGVHAKKRAARSEAEKKAEEHLKILIDNGSIESGDVTKLVSGIDVTKINALWKKHTTRKKKAR